VVLYHLPFNDIEFNQMCGRSGRDGAPARVHALFGAKDGRINEMILSTSAPARDDLGVLYLTLKDAQAERGPGFELTNQELADMVTKRHPKSGLTDRSVSSGIGVFRELGLVQSEGHGAYRRLTVLPAPETRLDLMNSVRYAEGLEEIAEFAEYRQWVLSADAATLLERFNRPLMPDLSLLPLPQ